jgi:hypothetical protein
VTIPYEYRYCSISELDGTCATYEREEVDSVPLIPPFTYNNQCASVILTSYIPVLILGYSIQFFLCFALPTLLIHIENIVDIKTIAQSGLFDGILWPRFWLRSSDAEILSRNEFILETNPVVMLNTRAFFCFEFLNNLVILSTFGLCSPILACAIVCVVVVKMNMRLLLLGRFTSIVSGEDNESTHSSLIALGDLYTPVSDVLRRSFRIIAGSSAIFISLVSWDIAADDVSWLDSVWIPITAIFFSLLLWMAGYYTSSSRNKKAVERTEMELVKSVHPVKNPIVHPNI